METRVLTNGFSGPWKLVESAGSLESKLSGVTTCQRKEVYPKPMVSTLTNQVSGYPLSLSDKGTVLTGNLGQALVVTQMEPLTLFGLVWPLSKS